MKLCMIGTGYVGLVSGVCFSDLGNDVICVDKDNEKINKLKKGIIPIYEPGLGELVNKNYKSKRLSFTSNISEAIKKSNIIFICVGTPTKKNSNAADLNQIFNVAKEISKNIKSFKIIINKSTKSNQQCRINNMEQTRSNQRSRIGKVASTQCNRQRRISWVPLCWFCFVGSTC